MNTKLTKEEFVKEATKNIEIALAMSMLVMVTSKDFESGKKATDMLVRTASENLYSSVFEPKKVKDEVKN